MRRRKLQYINVMTMLLFLSMACVLITSAVANSPDPGSLLESLSSIGIFYTILFSGGVVGWHTGRVLANKSQKDRAVLWSAFVSLAIYVGFCFLLKLITGMHPGPEVDLEDGDTKFSAFVMLTGLYNMVVGAISGSIASRSL